MIHKRWVGGTIGGAEKGPTRHQKSFIAYISSSAFIRLNVTKRYLTNVTLIVARASHLHAPPYHVHQSIHHASHFLTTLPLVPVNNNVSHINTIMLFLKHYITTIFANFFYYIYKYILDLENDVVEGH